VSFRCKAFYAGSTCLVFARGGRLIRREEVVCLFCFSFNLKDKDVNSGPKTVDKSLKALRVQALRAGKQGGQAGWIHVCRLSMVFPLWRFLSFVHKLSPRSAQNCPHP
jgi:hypothetical protein